MAYLLYTLLATVRALASRHYRRQVNKNEIKMNINDKLNLK